MLPPLPPRRPRSLRASGALLSLALLLVGCGGDGSKAVAWQTVRDAASDTSLTLTYALDTCQSLDRIEVAYSRTSVTVTVFEVPNHSACTGLRFVRSVEVPLRAPLAGRAVVDGVRRTGQ